MAASLPTLHPVGLPDVQVRVIEYRIEPHTAERLASFPSSQTSNHPDPRQLHRKVPTLLDPQQAPALELINCYHERWEIEACIDEQKTHLRLSGQPLQSRGAWSGAKGSLWAPPGALHRALVDASIRLRGQLGPRSPQLHTRRPCLRHRLLTDLREPSTLLPPRRLRFYPRVVKRAYSPFHRKRPGQQGFTLKKQSFKDILLI